jgi:hypothetical protein
MAAAPIKSMMKHTYRIDDFHFKRSRVLPARALYKRPSLLLLDEATSHLDIYKEKQVNEAIAALNITRIIIAHRHDTRPAPMRARHRRFPPRAPSPPRSLDQLRRQLDRIASGTTASPHWPVANSFLYAAGCERQY